MNTDPAVAHVDALQHEKVVVSRGRRSGLPIIVAVHSTRLGPALGGCRLWHYTDWRDGLADALRLSEGMSAKNSVAGLEHGGGKAVIVAPPEPLVGTTRRDAFLDLGDIVETFAGSYVTAEDVGTNAADMLTVAERTPHVVGLPGDEGGHGDPGEYTARGVYVSILTVLARIGIDDIRSARLAIAGLGQVGSRLARLLRDAGATLTVSDLNSTREAFAEEINADWAPADAIHRVPCDVFVPAGVGGMLTNQVIDELRCRAIVGPANNQLHERSGADRIAARGIVYAPDFIVNAGGVIYLGTPTAGPESTRRALAKIDLLGERLDEVFDLADTSGTTTTAAAERIAERRLQSV